VYASGARPLPGYTIKRGVGQGGFGEIYYATSDAGKDVALKLIRRNLDVELRGIHQCLNLKHPNLLSLYDIRQDNSGDTWVVMEYVADPSMDIVLSQHPKGLPPDQALYWIDGIGAGVAYLHDRGIVHRDLKPGNIFLDEGVVKVGDYGLSKYISCSRRSGHTESVGTVHYMAPEVANGRYGKEIDVYAMGVILYELLTGRVPFEGESIGEVLMKHLTAVPDVSMIAEPYRSVIAKALEKDPEKRYRSAAEMLAALPPCPAGGVRLDRSFLRAAVGVEDSGTAVPVDSHSGDSVVKAEAVAESSEDPVRRAVRTTREKIRRAWVAPRSDRSSRVIRIFTFYAGLLAVVLAPVLLPLVVVLAAAYAIHRLVWNVSGLSPEEATKRRQQIKKRLFLVFILALLLWQYGMLAIPWSVYIHGSARQRTVYMYESCGSEMWFLVFAPAAVFLLLFAARRLVAWVERDQPVKSWTTLKVIVVLALLLWQYGMLAIPWSVHSYANNGRSITYMYEHEGVDLWVVVFIPAAIVALLVVSRRLVAWMDRDQPVKTWTIPKTLVILALLLWQYGMLAVPWSRGYCGNSAWSNTYLYEHQGAELWFLVFAPSAILLLLFAARRLVSSMDGERPARSWADSPTIVMPPSPPEPTEPIVVRTADEPSPQPAIPAAAARRVLPRWYERPSPAMVLKPLRERVAELLGSLLGSTLVAALMAGALTLLEANMSSDSRVRPEEFGWLWLVGIVGAWAVLIPAKLWEGHRGDPVLRRFVMTVVGMGVGVAAFAVSQFLMVTLRQSVEIRHVASYDLSSFFGRDGQPLPMAYIACFGTLYLVMRWWRQADPLRPVRLGLWMLFLSGLVAFVAAQIWQFPQPWMPMAALTISASVQLAGPWHYQGRRRR
jgi:hypothetical protein